MGTSMAGLCTYECAQACDVDSTALLNYKRKLCSHVLGKLQAINCNCRECVVVVVVVVVVVAAQCCGTKLDVMT